MENASKALLISGGVLIAILIITIWVYLFATYSQFGESYKRNLSSREITKFNSNFIQFEGRDIANGNANITVQEIVSLYKFVRKYNIENEKTVEININGADNLTVLPGLTTNPIDVEDEKDFIEFIKSNSNKDVTQDHEIIYFECTEVRYDGNGMVEEITFNRI